MHEGMAIQEGVRERGVCVCWGERGRGNGELLVK